MHIHRLKISLFRNLKDFEISFDPGGTAPGERFGSHAVIGQNGAGKSNLLEAIVTVFRDLDLNDPASLDYELDYSVRGHHIAVVGQRGNVPTASIDGGDPVSGGVLAKHGREYLPSHVFAYYSGKNERIESLFRTHQHRFTNKLKKSSDDLMRRLFYCRSGHAQLVLLACLLSPDPVFAQLLRDLGIESIESALFVLKRPYNLRELKETDILEGDPRFWYARGTLVKDFLAKLWQLAVAPIDHEELKLVDFRGRREKQEQLYLYLSSKEKLKELGELVGAAPQFFRYAEGAYIGDLIDEVRITVRHKDAKGNISFDQLSEGELQLLTVLGLMRITSEDHCLFLLDEPDTHLNPIWKLRYFDRIEDVVRQGEGKILSGESQIIITTHDPLMIGGLRREQVRILRKIGDKSQVDMPTDHPQGMGVAGLLKSDMFGLASTLDQQTLRDLELRNELVAKQAREGLDEDEAAQLERLRHHLDELGFAREYRDPMYQLFIQKMYEVRSQPLGELLTPEQLKEQEELATRIVKELVSTERISDLSDLAQELKLRLGN